MTTDLIAGVELGGTKCVCVLGTASGEIVAEARVPTGDDPEAALTAVEAALDGWKAELGFGKLGIASFGPLHLDRSAGNWGFLSKTAKPGWNDVDIAGRLGRRYGLQAGFDTDVVGAALAEGRWGGAQGLDDFAYVTVGTGIGVGLITGGRPVLGFSHAEIGHVRVGRLRGDDWPGVCPFHGDCAEGLASGPAILGRAGVPAEQIAPTSRVWPFVADALAQMLHGLVLTASPRRILMGGGVMNGQPHLFPMIRKRLRASLGGFVGAAEVNEGIDSYIVPPLLGDRAGPLGALAVALHT